MTLGWLLLLVAWALVTGAYVALWAFDREIRLALRFRRQTILRLLHERGESYGLDLIKASDGVLERGGIYVLLADLEARGLVRSRYVDEPLKPGVVYRRRLYSLAGGAP